MSHKKHVFFGKVDLASTFTTYGPMPTILRLWSTSSEQSISFNVRTGRKDLVWWMERKHFADELLVVRD